MSLKNYLFQHRNVDFMIINSNLKPTLKKLKSINEFPLLLGMLSYYCLCWSRLKYINIRKKNSLFKLM